MRALLNFAYNTQKDTHKNKYRGLLASKDLKASLLQNVRQITKMH